MSAFVIVESPFAGETDHDGPGSIAYNLRYVRACMRDCILRGEAPFASHALYTQPGVLRDEVPEERELGMGLGWLVDARADYAVFYADLGWSSGMERGLKAANQQNKPYYVRRLGGEWSKKD